jgi:peptidoglycan L-alanyl-D-glutamate endopeptidase CwlK
MIPARILQWNFARIETGLLYPPFLAKLVEGVATLNDMGATFVATRGFSTFAEQGKLYAQGRDNTDGPIVTNAPAGLSAHNYGIATDFVRMLDEKTPSWEPQDYDVLGEVFAKLGLVWGGGFTRPDRPHVQWRSFVSGPQLAELRDIFVGTANRPMAAVWAHVTSTHDTLPMIPIPPSPSPEGVS